MTHVELGGSRVNYIFTFLALANRNSTVRKYSQRRARNENSSWMMKICKIIGGEGSLNFSFVSRFVSQVLAGCSSSTVQSRAIQRSAEDCDTQSLNSWCQEPVRSRTASRRLSVDSRGEDRSRREGGKLRRIRRTPRLDELEREVEDCAGECRLAPTRPTTHPCTCRRLYPRLVHLHFLSLIFH